MLAGLQWPEERRTVVTAVASLSNYVGGAAGVLFMPAVATSAPALLEVFRLQAFACVPLGLLMATWLWIPRPASPWAVESFRRGLVYFISDYPLKIY